MKKIVNIAIVGLGQIGNYLYNEIKLKKRIIGFNGHIYIKNIEPYFENDQSLSEIKEILFIDRNIYSTAGKMQY